MPTTIVKKGSLQPAQKPVTDMTFGLEVDANVVPGAPVAADAPRRAARMGGAREPSDSSSTAAPTTVRREGTFARISRVAPDGAKPTGVLSAHPATRAATREEMAVPRRASSSSLRSKRNGGD